MTSSPTLSCPQCGGQNAPDSKFCRHCGGSLSGGSLTGALSGEPGVAPESPSNALTGNAAKAVSEPSPSTAPSPGSGGAPLPSASSEIDARHARQLLERAHSLADRGEAAGAILACRQSIALAPNVAAGHAMLGRLLERTGDVHHALAAFEKAAQIAPDSALERDLSRLRDKTGAPFGAAIFNFNDDELFGGEDESLPAVAPATVPVATVPVAAKVPPSEVESDPLPFPNIGAAAPGLPPANSLAAHTPISQGAVPVIAVPVVVGGVVGDIKKKPVWNTLWARPSYFGRSLPLVGATLVALGFLSWARGVALARATSLGSYPTIAQVDPTASAVGGDASPGNSDSGAGAPPQLAPVGSAGASEGGFPISNQPLAPANTGTAGGRTNSSNAPARAANVPDNRPRIASVARVPRSAQPRFPPARLSPSIPPAPVPPASAAQGTTPRSNNSSGLTLPAPIIDAPAPVATPSNVLPAGSAPALNPAGASGRGYVRITQGRLSSSAPQRSASSDGTAGGGAGDHAIDNLTASINANSSDAGYRLQQRASLFLQRGDYSRAADDFQAAISAYNDQINRGEQVASARAGLRSAHAGLNLALAGGH